MGRFLNADAYASTEQGNISNNMFTYCSNNPVNRVDPTGQFWQELLYSFTQAIKQISGYFALAAGVTQVDSFVPGPADMIGAAMVFSGLIVGATIAIGSTIFANPSADNSSKTDKKVEAIATTKQSDNPVVFPADPNDFNPIGLVKVPRTGTKNGSFVSWMDPFSNTEVFRWDENPNYSNGAHYHIRGTGHFYPGDLVPDPYATIYFPFR